MRSSILFFLAPLAVLCDEFAGTQSAGDPATVPLCCSREGVADPSGTCKAMGLNSFACESFRRNDDRAQPLDPGPEDGCDNGRLELFPVGRDVKAFVADSKDKIKLGPSSEGDIFFAFIGCA
ncbi:hypothetical protein LY78DRAFT_711588 [Colletotrichum sublineola]|uniref:Uncharacterized protein n=1 Tax=Colletotrichum sublineola TaxID=1173701 RepID=A0A066XNV7_COLSU|nr:hypothetical protein LY78DRAFT_711588 [Colletotrichum sublineola]KDN67421.1 hypothetical protein CSUB01_11306 [Colletotrichum sublineola]